MPRMFAVAAGAALLVIGVDARLGEPGRNSTTSSDNVTLTANGINATLVTNGINATLAATVINVSLTADRENISLFSLPTPLVGSVLDPAIDTSTFEEDLAKAEASLLQSAFAAGGRARREEYWRNASVVSLAALGSASSYGHEYIATTTQYANTCCASCGKIDTAHLVAGTNYYAVASAQAMQNNFKFGGCCWCGKAGAGCGHHSGTAPMGCTACAKGRFIPKRPYHQPANHHDPLFHREINIVVADICPHKGNEAWCPAAEGRTNRFGSKNHFDFASPPPGFDNYYFAFTPTRCSGEIEHRLARMSKCHR